ncbi:MAG TPA: 50S ribosomal protein L35 [Bacillota bacterium]|nr:50S ribosomal protein L35 [Bacillota bacterium]
MPKMKTHSGAKKRFKLTGRGKVLRRKGYKSHLLGKKPATRKRRLRQVTLVSETMVKKIKKLMPYA